MKYWANLKSFKEWCWALHGKKGCISQWGCTPVLTSSITPGSLQLLFHQFSLSLRQRKKGRVDTSRRTFSSTSTAFSWGPQTASIARTTFDAAIAWGRCNTSGATIALCWHTSAIGCPEISSEGTFAFPRITCWENKGWEGTKWKWTRNKNLFLFQLSSLFKTCVLYRIHDSAINGFVLLSGLFVDFSESPTLFWPDNWIRRIVFNPVDPAFLNPEPFASPRLLARSHA